MSEPNLPAWTATYRGYDDVALTAAANAGLVRRGRGLLVSAPPSWVSSTAEDGVVLAHKQPVRLDGTGPTTARCPCPAAGVCVHVVLACQFVHDLVVSEADGDGEAAGSGDAGDGRDPEKNETTASQPSAASPAAAPASLALTDLTELTPERATAAAGKAASRAVAARLGKLRPELVTAEVITEPYRVSIAWEAGTVVLVAGAGWAGIVTPSGARHQRAAELRLEAIVRARTALALGWEWPADLLPEPTGGPLTPDERAFLGSVRTLLTGILLTGVARLDGSVAQRVEAAATASRTSFLIELSRTLGQVGEAMRQLLRESDAVGDADLVTAIARAWAFTRALESAEGDALVRLRGSSRDVADGGELAIQPLGAWTWRAATGARGATVAFLTRDGGGAIYESVAGRAHLQDPAFTPESAAIWGVGVRDLLPRTWVLEGALLGDARTVRSTERTQARPVGAHERDWIARAAVARWEDLPPVQAPRLVGGRSELFLLAPAQAQSLHLDEVDQELVWPLIDAQGEVLNLRLGVLGIGSRAADNLMRLAESVESTGLTLRQVLVRREARGFIPLSAIVELKNGSTAIRSFTLGWPVPSPGLWQRGFHAMRKALEVLRARVERRGESEPEPLPHPVLTLCERAREACVDVAVTGRSTLGEQEQQAVRELAMRCSDAGLAVLANALDQWAASATGTADPEAMLRVALVAERSAVVAAGV